MFKVAFDEAPGYESARFFYAVALDVAGRSSEADALLKEAYGTSVVNNDQLLGLYLNFKLYDRAIAIWKSRVTAAPSDVSAHEGLATVYFAACRLPQVIAELKEIARLSPQSAGQMAELEKQINNGTLQCGK